MERIPVSEMTKGTVNIGFRFVPPGNTNRGSSMQVQYSIVTTSCPPAQVKVGNDCIDTH